MARGSGQPALVPQSQSEMQDNYGVHTVKVMVENT